MTRSATAVVAIVLAVLVVAGGATALASRGRSGPPEVPADGAGSSEVELSPDAAEHPAAEEVRAQLQRHYDAINGRDYTQWRATVVPARAEAMSEAEWQKAYATTRDGSIRVDRIDPDPDAGPGGGLLVRVRFISTQAVENAPSDLQVGRICWRSTLPMRGTPPLIDLTGGGSSAREAC
ncbi:hypothetical protein [Pseudonocardia adelaidensis]|uniref:Mce-associated membrane protein n=1 Tax=Pseudonocardia adelaidensis TaxID=648754 RepID=A0ABP9P803_9PSEU